MKIYRLVIDVELPGDVPESEVDCEIANVISDFGGQVIDSREFQDITKTNEVE